MVRMALMAAAWLLVGAVGQAQDTPQPPRYDPDSEDHCESVVKEGADKSGNPDLRQSIQDGSTSVFFGDPGTGNNAMSFFDDEGNFIIIVRPTYDAFALFAAAAHEWWHKNNPAVGPPPPEGTEERAVWDACQEAGANCFALEALKALNSANPPLAPPCALVDKVNVDASNSKFTCEFGPDGTGPKEPDPCGIGTIDCTE